MINILYWWVLRRVPMRMLSTALLERGWVAIPGEYAVKYHPTEFKTGWWPKL